MAIFSVNEINWRFWNTFPLTLCQPFDIILWCMKTMVSYSCISGALWVIKLKRRVEMNWVHGKGELIEKISFVVYIHFIQPQISIFDHFFLNSIKKLTRSEHSQQMFGYFLALRKFGYCQYILILYLTVCFMILSFLLKNILHDMLSIVDC